MDGQARTYPDFYENPDIGETEHLIQAAWHLIQIGRAGAADELIESARALFDDVPVNERLKLPHKTLGRVEYYPAGVMKVRNGSKPICVPAGPYDPYGEPTENKPDARLNRWTAKVCRDADVTWFVERQITCAVAGKTLSAAAFRPARILASVTKLCRAHEDGMPPEAAAILAGKLERVLDKNPASHSRYTRIRQELNGKRYRTDRTAEFQWLSESELAHAADTIRRSAPDAIRQIREIPKRTLTWKECGDSVQVKTLFYRTLRKIRDSKNKFVAGHRNREQDRELRGLFAEIHGACNAALSAAADVSNLQKTCAAMAECGDKYLYNILTEAGMIDPKTDYGPDLWYDTAMLRITEVYGMTNDTTLAEDTIGFMRAFLRRPDVRDFFSNGKPANGTCRS